MLAVAIRGRSRSWLDGLMRNWLKAFGIFALVVAVPFLLERLLGRHPRLPSGSWFKSFDWDAVIIIGSFIVVILVAFAVFAWLGRLIFVEADEISDLLTLAEREMNALLRGWGGGFQGDTRKNMAVERASWLGMIPKEAAEAVSDVYKEFYNQNQKELGGGPQGDSMSKARITAFLLREVYEGNVETAQLKIVNEFKNSGKLPFIAPGLRQLLDVDQFDEKKGFPKGSGVAWFPLILAVKLHRHPRHIIMVKPDKSVVRNEAVIDELNRQLEPAPAKT